MLGAVAHPQALREIERDFSAHQSETLLVDGACGSITGSCMSASDFAAAAKVANSAEDPLSLSSSTLYAAAYVHGKSVR